MRLHRTQEPGPGTEVTKESRGKTNIERDPSACTPTPRGKRGMSLDARLCGSSPLAPRPAAPRPAATAPLEQSRAGSATERPFMRAVSAVQQAPPSAPQRPATVGNA